MAEEDEHQEYPMYTIKSATAQPISAELLLNDAPVTMEIDTGATLSIMSKQKYLATWPSETDAPPLRPSSTRLRTYTGESIHIVGAIDVQAEYADRRVSLELGDGHGPELVISVS